MDNYHKRTCNNIEHVHTTLTESADILVELAACESDPFHVPFLPQADIATMARVQFNALNLARTPWARNRMAA